MFVMGALHHEDSSLRGDEFQKQERIPWRNVDYSGRKSHCDGTELVKPPISAEFNDFGKNELFMFGAERDQQVNSNVEGLRLIPLCVLCGRVMKTMKRIEWALQKESAHGS
ncbi:hypothetical protein RhiirA1_105742 [Rhizophagus irregularis]|uniref:Uncharacterized protein n=1 Tax=Rhizophagus irregularis TaxID=588596 RepID=A0A2I1EAU2_9GLOM|nr:hypothetical protein RhiirA1_105742 [Rhizophagus irregularis]PKY19256.1 hypothetical protein RhiirB3_127337 [Rhizophagus irregularis]